MKEIGKEKTLGYCLTVVIHDRKSYIVVTVINYLRAYFMANERKPTQKKDAYV